VNLLRKPVVYISCFAILVALAAGSFWLWHQQDRVTIPRSLASKTLFPVYIPKSLPKGYFIANDSYQIKDGALIFAAHDQKGRTISITEQARPQNFDFTNFYQTNLQNAKSIPHAPYPSVIGVIQGTNRLASVTATDTWMLISAPLAYTSDADIQRVAVGMTPQ